MLQGAGHAKRGHLPRKPCARSLPGRYSSGSAHRPASRPGATGGTPMPTVQITFSEIETLIMALVALFIGKGVRASLPWLKRIDLPDAVVGGLVAAVLAL